MEIASTNTTPAGNLFSLQRYLGGRSGIAFSVFFFLTCGVLGWAWMVREFRYIQAESGLGYALGIIGVTMMTLLLLYPLRKRLRFMQRWLTVKSWFRAHMLLGVLGPGCILLHCNFQVGSTNSTVALVAMLLVAGSGLVGRYLYGKFHYGLYGKQVELSQLKDDIDEFHNQTYTQDLPEEQRSLLAELYAGCCRIIDEQHVRVSFLQLMKQRRWLRRRIRLILKMDAGGQNHYREFAALLDKLAGLRLFERLFGLWHVVHIPVFLLMILTAVVHIFVVHWF